MQVVVMCPICGKTGSVSVNQKSMEAYRNGMSIQEAFPKMKACDREMLISGMCYRCQEDLWNRPCNDDGSWGELLGECPCCGRPIWSIHDDVKDGSEFNCSGCGLPMRYVNGVFEEIEE